MDKVIVNGIGLSGGGLILLENYLKSSENENVVFIVFSEKKLRQTKNSKIIIRKYFKSSFGRLYFILFGFTIFYRKNRESIKSILSFINLGFPFITNTNQVIYYHQPIPLLNQNWSIFDKDERSLWFYKNVYPLLIRLVNKRRFTYVVQTSWVSDKLKEKFGFNNIIIEQPQIVDISIDVKVSIKINNKDNFIFPSGYTIYKNHLEIINAVEYIKNTNIKYLEKINVIFTLEENSVIFDIVKKKKLQNNFQFIGHKPIEEIYKYYLSGCVLLFPSKAETFGLPLLEAARFGCKIIAGDTLFANEILNNYDFYKCGFNNPKEWSCKMIEAIKERSKSLPISHSNKHSPWFLMNSKLFKQISS